MKKMTTWILIIIILAAVLIVCGMLRQTKGTEETEWMRMESTAYCAGTIRCDGGPARVGVCAGATRYYGMTAIMYEDDGGKPGEYLGTFEILDTGGDYRIKNGTCLDVFLPSERDCILWGRKKVLVKMVEGKG